MKDDSVIRELQRIAMENGGILKPEIVVREARPETSPLHGKFDWDNDEAADQWRLLQARNLIRVAVRFEQVAPGKVVEHRVFVSLTPDREEEGGGYRVLADVLSDEVMRRQLLEDARRDMKLFKNKYEQLHELAEVFRAMDDVSEPIPA